MEQTLRAEMVASVHSVVVTVGDEVGVGAAITAIAAVLPGARKDF